MIRSKITQREQSDPPPRRHDTDTARAWSLILSAARLARNAAWSLEHPLAMRADPDGRVSPVDPAHRSQADLLWLPHEGWRTGDRAADRTEDCHGEDPARALFDLYLPFCRPHPGPVEVIAHLGQSIDGYIATSDGDARFVTGKANIRHLHRMRALSDAVLVGAETVAADDPRLTTRLVAGPNAMRVVLDPRRRLSPERHLFNDGESETLLCCDRARIRPGEQRHGQAELIGVPAMSDGLDLGALLGTLAERGLRRIFIEGGGTTVSRFLEAGLLSRLQIAVAPLVIGSGRPGVRLPPTARLADALRPATRIFRMGEDVLYDFDLSAGAPDHSTDASPQMSMDEAAVNRAELSRIR
ncbi:RibD family protein [Thiocapsa rosea]|uniref:Riboflavin-specific deaminase-like protein n=1 Tax=Thiocapsa rosea TaxID=69360 RepID=A0A495VA28_9GAMM|nr:RibD family protein [Thiocapsa rosea]RKT46252.1 riboflavin-specific deaminase-like protein [Thiocapsa rosea]